MPAVTALSVDSRVTRFAERYQIVSRVRAAFGQRSDMMDLLDGHKPAGLQAFLAQPSGEG